MCRCNWLWNLREELSVKGIEGGKQVHIVIVTIELASYDHPAGGLGSFTANMAQIFAQNGHKVDIVLAATKEEKIIFDNAISVWPICVKKTLWEKFDKIAKLISYMSGENRDEVRRYLMNLYKARYVRKLINSINDREKIDIVHFCNHGALSLWHNKKIPYVIRVSGLLNIINGGANQPAGSVEFRDNNMSIRHKLEYYTLRKAKYVISPSFLMAETIKNNGGIQATVIESPFVLNIDNWDYSIYNMLVRDRKYIIHYGALKYLKGIHIVADIAENILSENPDIVILLVGNSTVMHDESGEAILAHELVKKKAGKYAERVIYAGCLMREQLYPLIQKAELCLLPYRLENLSNACIEAMAMGKVVVGTDKASFEQLIVDRSSGFLCERDNAKDYLLAVNEALMLSDKERTQMGERARERIQKLAPELIYTQYLNYYQKIAQEWR